MSFFKHNKYREKPNLPEEAPAKNGFFLFFELFFRKFWRLIALNIFYFIITLPMLMLAFLMVNGFYTMSKGADNGVILFQGLSFLLSLFSFTPEWMFAPMLILSAVLYGPATMGLTYMFRNYAREEHAWLSDFWARSRANFKQGVFFGIMDIFVLYFLTRGVFGNLFVTVAGSNTTISALTGALCVLLFIVWGFMRNYTYLMAVTVELSVFSILKNAWTFSILGIGRNLLSAVVTLVCFVVCFMLSPAFTIIFVPLFFYSLTWFCTIFTCYPVVKKYIVDPAMEAAAKKGESN